jgi:hypothetical protein
MRGRFLFSISVGDRSPAHCMRLKFHGGTSDDRSTTSLFPLGSGPRTEQNQDHWTGNDQIWIMACQYSSSVPNYSPVVCCCCAALWLRDGVRKVFLWNTTSNCRPMIVDYEHTPTNRHAAGKHQLSLPKQARYEYMTIYDEGVAQTVVAARPSLIFPVLGWPPLTLAKLSPSTFIAFPC